MGVRSTGWRRQARTKRLAAAGASGGVASRAGDVSVNRMGLPIERSTGDWVSRVWLVVGLVGVEGDAVDDSDGADLGGEGAALEVAGCADVPVLEQVVDAGGPSGVEVVLEAASSGVDDGVVVFVHGGGVGESEMAGADKEVDVWDEALDGAIDADAAAVGVLADVTEGAGGDLDAGLKRGDEAGGRED